MKKLLILLLFTSCSTFHTAVVYEGRGLVVRGVLLGDHPERGKYIYITDDLAGEVVIWSDAVYDLGDTIRVQRQERYISYPK